MDAKGYQASFALEKCTGNLYLLGVAFGVSFLVWNYARVNFVTFRRSVVVSMALWKLVCWRVRAHAKITIQKLTRRPLVADLWQTILKCKFSCVIWGVLVSFLVTFDYSNLLNSNFCIFYLSYISIFYVCFPWLFWPAWFQGVPPPIHLVPGLTAATHKWKPNQAFIHISKPTPVISRTTSRF